MSKRALLIGAATGELLGVGNDLDTWTETISARGFEITRIEDASATRDGILSAYNALIERTDRDDAVLVAASCHGGVVEQYPSASAAEPGGSDRYQFIVPYDFDASTEEDFRGITALELSYLQDQLTSKTSNVTVILDCCYASGMSRDVGLTPRALYRPVYADITAHLERIKARGMSMSRRAPAGNQSAVRLVAAAPNQTAFEYESSGNKRIGVFTEALCNSISAIGEAPVSWEALMPGIRRRVQMLSPLQRPEAEGPVRRLLFSTEISLDAAPVQVVLDGDKVMLDGGRVRDIEVGDVFVVMPPMSSTVDDGRSIARATVAAVGPLRAAVEVEFLNEATNIPRGALAFPISLNQRRYPVTVAGQGPIVDEIRKAISVASHVRPVEKDDIAPLATVTVTPESLTLEDRAGSLTDPVALTNASATSVVASLNRLARAASLRALTPRGNESLNDFTVEIGSLKDGNAEPIPDTASPLFAVGDRVYVRFQNTGTMTKYFYLFDIGVTGRITLVTNWRPSGMAVGPGENYTVGQDEMRQLIGVPLFWPTGVPIDQPRPETLLVIATDIEQDLSALQQEAASSVDSSRSGRGNSSRSQLGVLLDQIAIGGSRDAGEVARVDTFGTYPLNFLLYPAPIEVGTGDFLLDERPDPSLRLLIARSMTPPPQRIAVRLRELKVLRNRALYSADIRVDTLAITGGSTAGQPLTFSSRTEQFNRIQDGELLPMDGLMMYHGPVHDYLELAVWVTRNRSNALDLSQLLNERLNDANVQQALITVATVAGAAPQAALAAAAVGATARLIDLAYKVLSSVVGNSIGVYRNCVLAREQFGIGRHPKSGLLRAQDFAFNYEVLDVDSP